MRKLLKENQNLDELHLSGSYIKNLLPEIFELKNLTKLGLYNNGLTQLPPEIKKLQKLTELFLSVCALSHLPPEIKELKNLTKFHLFHCKLSELPPEIFEIENLTELDISYNDLTHLPSRIRELKKLEVLDIKDNKLTQLPPEVIELKNLKILNLETNQLTQLPLEATKLKNLTELYLGWNQLIQLPPEIQNLKNLTRLSLTCNKLTRLPVEIGKLKNLEVLNLHNNQLTQLIPEILLLENLIGLVFSWNKLSQLPFEIGKLKNLEVLNLDHNQLTQLVPKITELENLTILVLSHNQLSQLPNGIGVLKNLKRLYLENNNLTKLPLEITKLNNLETLSLSENPLTSPPPEIASMGAEAIFTYFEQSKTLEHNEAKLILVGDPGVGKTCLAHRLITNEFLKNTSITEGVKILEWVPYVPEYKNIKIKLNIWDFGGQDVYHATHQFFLTKRSVYVLIWNASKTNDYDNVYYWLYTIEAFGEDSPIILVMSKVNENDDDLNIRDLRNKFPQIVDYLKIDSENGKGIHVLREKIFETAWKLPLMRAMWVDSWYKVREKLEELGENWISYDKFYDICTLEGLDNKNIGILDEYLHELGVTLHFKDRISLDNIVILKPEWATVAFYRILSTKSVVEREGILLNSELQKIWDLKTYPPSIYPFLMELMNKFELAYELPDKRSYLVPELLPKNAPDNFEWDVRDDLCLYYSYDSFIPPGIIPRFIVLMHRDIEKKENGLPLCWGEGAVLNLHNSRALVKIKPDERLIEISVNGGNKRGAMGAICNQLDQINVFMKKIKVSKQIPCNCSENCPQRYPYENLLKAEQGNKKIIQCHESYKNVSISSLLDGYKEKEERIKEYKEYFEWTEIHGDVIMGNIYNMNNNKGIMNFQSTLNNSIQTINNTSALADTDKKKLTDLLEELKKELEPVASKKPKETEDITEFVKSVAEQVSKEEPNKSFLETVTDGLEKAAKKVEHIAPKVLPIAKSIAKLAMMI